MGYEGGKRRGAVLQGGARTEGAPGSAMSGDKKRTAPRGASKAAAGRRWDRVGERLKIERSGGVRESRGVKRGVGVGGEKKKTHLFPSRLRGEVQAATRALS